MTTRLAGMPAHTAARFAGVLYLIIIAGGLFAEAFVRQQLIVPGDPGATVRNILEQELLYRVGFAVHLFYLACALPLMLIFYRLFQRVSRDAALLALLFGVVAITIEGVNLLNHLAPVRLLAGESLDALSLEQLHSLLYAYASLFGSGFAISLVFFGVFCYLLGYLIYRSGFLPRFLGILMGLAGLCYLTNSFSLFIAPGFASLLFPYILLPCLAAELALALWLVVMGVNVREWENRAA